MYDLRITGGKLIDGSGSPGFFADLPVKDGRIVAIGRLDAPAGAKIDSARAHSKRS